VLTPFDYSLHTIAAPRHQQKTEHQKTSPFLAMVERYEGDTTLANFFGCRYLPEWEACRMYETRYMASSNM
jgi:hypothetical protein